MYVDERAKNDDKWQEKLLINVNAQKVYGKMRIIERSCGGQQGEAYALVATPAAGLTLKK